MSRGLRKSTKLRNLIEIYVDFPKMVADQDISWDPMEKAIRQKDVALMRVVSVAGNLNKALALISKFRRKHECKKCY